MMKKILEKEDLRYILYIIFENYKLKNMDFILEEDSIELVYRFISDSIPTFMKTDIKIEKKEDRVSISSAEIDEIIEYKPLDNYDLSECNYQTKEVVEYIVDLEDEAKKLFLEKVSKENSMSINDIYKIYREQTLCSGKPEEEKIKSWIYDLTTPNTLSEESARKMVAVINEEITDEMVNSYLKEILSKKESISLDYFLSKNDFYKLMLFYDLLEVEYKDVFKKKINFDFEFIKEWWADNILPIFVNTYAPEQLSKELNLEIKRFDTVDFYGQNFKALKATIVEVLQEKSEEQEKIDKRFSLDENRFLKRVVDSIDLESVNNIFDLREQFKSVDFKYEENKYIRNDKYSEKLIELLEDGNIDISIKELESFVNENKMFFNEKVYIFMQVYIQKELDKLKSKLEEDIKDVDSLEEIDKLQDEILANGDFVVCRDIENIIMLKIEEIVKKLNLADINDEKKIELGIKIYNKMNVVDISEYEIAGVFIDRDISLDLDSKRDTIDKLRDLQDDIYDIVLMNCMFNCDYYNLNINIKGSDEVYVMKFKYMDNLVDFISTKGKDTILSRIASISKKKKFRKRVFKRSNVGLVKELEEFYSKKK